MRGAGFAPAAHAYNTAYMGGHPIHMAGAGYQPSYYQHSFYHGPWSGQAWGWGWGLGRGYGYGYGPGGWGGGYGGGWGYGGYGGWYRPYGYWGRPLGWGFGGWGLGYMAYNSGYSPYYNPYYYAVPNQVNVYNYSNPIPVAADVVAVDGTMSDDSNESPAAPQTANPDFDAARSSFRDENYDAALASVDSAIAAVPTDAVLHEFRALVLFAMQDYKQAAAVIHSVLAIGPGWDWTTMSSLYADPDTYTQQLRALEQYTLANPKAADAHFLLSYHYTTTGHSDAAAFQLQQVVRLMPNDKLAGELLKMIQGPAKNDPAPEPTPGAVENSATVGNTQTSSDAPQPPPIDKALLPGSWKAARADKSNFDLTLTDDGKFTWKFSPPKQKVQEFGGTYTTDGPVLILERAEGGALAGVATFDGADRFNFRMVGAPPEDKGLDFSK